MQTATLIQCSPAEFTKLVTDELLKQLSGTTPAAAPINPDDVPDQSAYQAAKYLRCSPAHLATLVGKYPQHLKPINEEKRAVRYKFAQLHYLKINGLVK
jgi:hypothetical protein